MIKCVVCNGMPEVGKTTFEDLCIKELGVYGHRYSTIDSVKRVARACGWDGEKNSESRKYLSDLKDLLSNWLDYSFRNVMSYCHTIEFQLSQFDMQDKTAYIFIDSREPEEIQRFKEELGAITLLIRRPSQEKESYSNHADSEVLNYDYDYTIYNDGTIEDLKSKAKSFIIELQNKERGN